MRADRRKWWDIKAAAGGKATIRIYGDIGDSWWGDSVSAKSFSDELEEMGNLSSIELHLNSPGGDAFDGVAIMNVLRDHAAHVTVIVDGLAASAASIIAMAGDTVVMGRGSQMMIHDAASIGFGNAAELRKAAQVLDSISDSMASVYAERAGGTAGDWRAVMAEETWYGAEEAVEAGLADEVRKIEADSDDGPVEPREAAARALAGSRFAARFRYTGRAAAPAPRRPVADRRRADTQEGSRDVEFTTDQLTTLRELGLPVDQDPATLVAAVAEALSEQAQADPAPQAAAGAPQLPEGVVAIGGDVLAQLQADAAQGRAAREDQVRERRDGIIAAALRQGRITAATRETWRAELDRNEEGTAALLQTLTPVVNTTERGHDGGSLDKAEAVTSYEQVVEDPTYQRIWKG
jgi:ATP-dependent protease ClpP protease subunit